MELLRPAALLAATMTMGIGAGVYQLYAFAIMPGLRRTDDRTFVGAFQQIDTAIVGPFLLIFFVGALVFTALAGAFHLGVGERSALPWIGGAFALQLAVLIITIAINVPLNDEIKAAGDPGEIADLGAVRGRFNEAKWAGWNLIRVVASTVAFGSLAWALVLHGRL
ncbi:MAG: DUF1772 domain-containing protein [Chloroflexi bacterium]|nr:DUF1772 domain-containing protein [Chloroflexota bacterium]